MKRTLMNQKGFTLIEIITVLIISTLLILVSAVGLSVFFGKYQEINAYVELQKDAMELLNFIKNGYYVGSGNSIQFNGVASATALEITGRTNESGKGSGIKITPPLRNEYPFDFIHYYLQDGVIRVNYMYNGIQVNTPVFLFPKRALKDKVFIESFKVSDANANNTIFTYKRDEGLCVVNVELKAKVMTQEDKFRTIEFKTVMAMKNMSRPEGGS